MPCSGEEHPCPLAQTLESGKPFQTTHIHKDRKERDVFFSISTYPLFEGDDIVGAIEISRDITKDMKMQKVMMHQEKLASIGRLSAGVAHEINNPLTTILTTAMLIQEDLEKDDPIYEELQTITNETLRCRKIVTSLLNFARQTKPTKKIADPNQVVSESIMLTKKQAAFKDVEIEFDPGEDVPSICLDPGQIQQALINLIINAVEATDPGGKITVKVKRKDDRHFIEILVSDTGCGIDQEDLEKVVDPFFTTKDDGTGLGLAITHGIIEQHQGTLNVESKLGEGATFIICLPIERGESHGG
jgi:signal transduction histidine kinase